MTSQRNPNRVPRGTPTGGQFAGKSHPESDVELEDAEPPPATSDRDEAVGAMRALRANATPAEEAGIPWGAVWAGIASVQAAETAHNRDRDPRPPRYLAISGLHVAASAMRTGKSIEEEASMFVRSLHLQPSR